jgi:hypothetical protein
MSGPAAQGLFHRFADPRAPAATLLIRLAAGAVFLGFRC